MNVLLTVDTEVWPSEQNWRTARIGDLLRRDVYGATPEGEYGIRYQIDRLNAHGLKAVYFIEALFASALGPKALEEIVETVQGSGHEAQLHVHTEWLRHIGDPELPVDDRQHIRQFSVHEQQRILARARDNLRAAGAKGVTAFRAGNFGANRDTLRVLGELGIAFDSSYNVGYLANACQIATDELLVQPRRLDGLVEAPVSFFRDLPNHYRPAHINACSSAEMQHALLQAWRRGWKSFVIVTHSFELLTARRSGPHPVVRPRFDSLCRFLADHPDKFTTVGFGDVSADGLCGAVDPEPIASNAFRTAWRMVEQLRARCAS